MEPIRLQKFLAERGVASRRKSEELILDGRVKVNGVAVIELGTKVSDSDLVEVDNRRVEIAEKKVYIMIHKPVGYVTTVKDQFARPTVLDLLKGVNERVYPVGRLDYDTSGLLLLTNDGDFTYKLTHPKHEMKKIYMAEIEDVPKENELERFRQGLDIEDYRTAPANIRVVKIKEKTSVVEIIIHEGRNRQVRKMCEAIGHPVKKLMRAAIGNVSLNDLPEGKWRLLKKEEIEYLSK